MQLVSARCPNCGANVRVPDDAESVTCSYCGTQSRLQRRSRILQIPQPLPPQPSLLPIARQRISRAAILIPLGLTAAAAGIGVLGAVAQRVATGGKYVWGGTLPVIADVDRDGTQDPIGIATYYMDNQRSHLAAFSGVDGHRLWESQALAKPDQKHRWTILGAGSMVLWGDAEAGLHAFDVATGAARWSQNLGEHADLFCAGADAAHVVVKTADDRWHAIGVADGAVSDTSPLEPPVTYHWPSTEPSKLAPCRELAHQRRTLDGATMDDDSATNRIADGMYVDFELVRGTRRIAVGYKSPGTQVPMLAGVGPDRKLTWKLEVPATDVFDVDTGSPKVALDDDAVAALCERRDDSSIVTLVDAATGARRWVTRVGAGWLGGLALTPTAVMVADYRAGLIVLDRKTGQQRFAIGKY